MNSMLQCLSNTTLLTNFFVSKKYVEDINRVNVNSNGGRLAEAYGNLMEAMWSGNDKVVKPQDMKAEMGRICSQFAGFQQQDSQEFLVYLLDNLHEDLNRIKNPPYVEDYDGHGEPDETIAKEQWNRFLKSKLYANVIVNHFYCFLPIRCQYRHFLTNKENFNVVFSLQETNLT